jgi:hypothetical protein
MDIILIILGALLIVVGLIGSLLPIMPGLPFSYLGLVLLQFTDAAPFSLSFFIVWAVIVVALMFLDNIIPAYGTKKFGGSKLGIAGCMVGLFAGFFFPPLGFIFGPLIGAFLGELIAGNSSDKAFKAAMGSFIGFLASTGLKLMAASVMAFYYFSNVSFGFGTS